MYKVTLREPNEYEFYNILEILTEEGVIATYQDCGEPEDQTFLRNFSWIKQELERAYQRGLKDGKIPLNQFKGKK